MDRKLQMLQIRIVISNSNHFPHIRRVEIEVTKELLGMDTSVQMW